MVKLFEDTTDAFKVGDIVEHRGGDGKRREVIGVHGDLIWVKPIQGDTLPFTGRAAMYQKPDTFFKRDMIYVRQVQWSIHAQANSVTERFTVKEIQTNLDGSKVAFGYLTADAYGRWLVKGRFDWKEGGWKVEQPVRRDSTPTFRA